MLKLPITYVFAGFLRCHNIRHFPHQRLYCTVVSSFGIQPFCTIDPNVVQCIVPDKNFKYLADTWKPPSVVPAALKVTDIAGLIRGASEGAGLGNAFLSHIAAVDGIYHLVRAFDSDEVVHVDDSVDPIRDLETIQGELCAKDSATLAGVLENEVNRVRKEKGLSRSSTNFKLSEAFQEAYDKSKKLLDSNTPIQTGEFSAAEVDCIKDWGMITTKPQIYVINLSQKNFIRKGSKWLPKINEWVQSHGGRWQLDACIFGTHQVECLNNYMLAFLYRWTDHSRFV